MGRNILVVEDDRNISDLIQMYLLKEGFDVRTAADGGRRPAGRHRRVAGRECDRRGNKGVYPEGGTKRRPLPRLDGDSGVRRRIYRKFNTPDSTAV